MSGRRAGAPAGGGRALAAVLVLGLLAAADARAAADEAGAGDAAATVVKTKDGLRFTVPPDWPIEERNGVVAPIPVEEYLGRKFAGMESRLRTLEQQVNSFDLRIRVLEEHASRGQAGGLRSGQ